jgi:hypothetical protein
MPLQQKNIVAARGTIACAIATSNISSVYCNFAQGALLLFLSAK